jgi:tRNA(fMet)-specific endonuclease VapC
VTGAFFMLDTNIISHVLQNPLGDVARELRQHGLSSVCTSSIVASEMRYGALKKGSRRLQDTVAAMLDQIEVLDYDDIASHHYADVRHSLEILGTPIGSTDLFIAAHAKSLDLTFVTDNVREFSRVEGLKIENWIKREDADVE